MTIDQTEPSARPGLRRRGVLGTLGAGTVTAALASAGGTMLGSRSGWAQAVTDADLFNFALNFEYLGAEYYLHGLTGQGLPPNLLTGTGTRGAVLAGGPTAFQSTAIPQYVQRLAVDELGHVQFIRAVLGAAAIAEPQIDLSVASWTATAIAAGLIAPGQTFNPYASDVGFLLGAYVLEEVCVTALAGAARFVTSKDNLEAAAGLLGVEGYQSGAIRTLLANVGAGAATNAISALRANLSGVGDNGILSAGLQYNFTNTDTNALVFRRTPRQVLNIAYGAVGATKGGFFPNGVNGTITA